MGGTWGGRGRGYKRYAGTTVLSKYVSQVCLGAPKEGPPALTLVALEVREERKPPAPLPVLGFSSPP